MSTSCISTSGCGASIISIYAGRDKTISVSLTTNTPTTGTAVDLTGVGIWFGVKNSSNDLDVDAVILKRNLVAGGSDSQIFVDDPLTGTFYIYLVPDDTVDLDVGTYTYDIVIQTEDGKFIEAVPPSEFVVMATIIKATQ